MSKIQWNKVTWYSKLLAVILFTAVFAWAFYLGQQYERVNETLSAIPPVTSITTAATASISESLLNSVAFGCDSGKTIQAQFMENTVGQGSVALQLSDGRNLILPQTISADGGRYAKPDESFVFWTKGNGAFVQEGAPYATSGQKTTFSNCVVATSTNS